MKFQFWSVGKSHESYVKEGIDMFTKRINHYYAAEWKLIPVPKNTAMLSEADLKIKEGAIILDWIHPDDYLVALDEKGKMISSESLAAFIQSKNNQSIKKIVFLIGGAYGLSEAVIKRANYIWSLSDLVFPHQLVRLILSEQVYRACTIIKNEKYHHA
jgi:23S rRNA (pseudouridine1915-N3)-methyltransferase